MSKNLTMSFISPIQGSSADIIKLAMINVHRALREERVDARLILRIHDELIVEAKPRLRRACGTDTAPRDGKRGQAERSAYS